MTASLLGRNVRVLNICSPSQFFLAAVLTMSVASSSAIAEAQAEHDRRMALWDVMTWDLRAAGVPLEAFPRRLPRIYEAYTVKSTAPASVRIQVLLRRGAFLVANPPGYNRSPIIEWDGNAAQAWDDAKRVAGW